MTFRDSIPQQQATGPGHTVLFAGGGSAGHVAPMLATAKALVEARPDVRVVALGTDSGLEVDLVPAAGFELLTIPKVPFPRRPSPSALAFPGAFAGTVRHVRRLIREHNVQAIAGFGGYVCPPAYLAGALARAPITIHEANKRPGLANRLGAHFATNVVTAFDPPAGERALPGAVRLGMPMRREISQLDRIAHRHEARRALGLRQDMPTVLVTGGSLGAQHLNEVVVSTLGEFGERGIQILHITGKGKRLEASGEHYHQLEYVTAMEELYAAADFAITRSGAGTVSELAAVGLPALFVPLPIGNGEQALNGQDVVEAGGARMIADADLTPEALVDVVDACVLKPEVLDTMSQAASRFGIRTAARDVAALVASTLPPARFSTLSEAS